MPLLFVYGTLLEGERNHRLLDGSHRVGAALTRKGYALLDCGPYPALVEAGAGRVHGELYVVSPPLLLRLDEFEEHPTLFERRPVALERAPRAWAYFLPGSEDPGLPRIRGGRWRGRTPR
ncbi:MAG: gamma-glutamylcyclotransferase family protein [Thermoanaerobaculia bacterium]